MRGLCILIKCRVGALAQVMGPALKRMARHAACAGFPEKVIFVDISQHKPSLQHTIGSVAADTAMRAH